MSQNKLEIGKTCIANVSFIYKNEERTVKVFYGNWVQPLIDNKFVSIPYDEYMSFYKSFIGKHPEYIIPTEEDHKNALCKAEKFIDKVKKEKGIEKDIQYNKPEEVEDPFVYTDKTTIDEADILELLQNEYDSIAETQSNKEETDSDLKNNSKEENKEESLLQKSTIKSSSNNSNNIEISKTVSNNNSQSSKDDVVEVPKKELQMLLEAQEQAKELERVNKENVKLANEIVKAKKSLSDERNAHNITKLLKAKEKNQAIDEVLLKVLSICMITQSLFIMFLLVLMMFGGK